jgi:hypothetical protein
MSIFLKKNQRQKWRTTTEKDVLAYLKDETRPLSDEEKDALPVFGFDKQAGASANAQQYPTNWIILEIDAPKFVKRNPDRVDAWRNRVMTWYVTLRLQADLQYYWLYLTRSMCGLRFVLKTDRPIASEAIYEAVVFDYLQHLSKITNGDINESQHDILVNQAWFVPTFKQYFSAKNAIYSIGNVELSVHKAALDKANFVAQQTFSHYNHLNTMDYFEKAERFTQKNFTYTEGSRNAYLHCLICNLNRFGLSKSDTEGYVISNYDLPHREVNQTIKGVYSRNANEHAKFINQIQTNDRK